MLYLPVPVVASKTRKPDRSHSEVVEVEVESEVEVAQSKVCGFVCGLKRHERETHGKKRKVRLAGLKLQPVAPGYLTHTSNEDSHFKLFL